MERTLARRLFAESLGSAFLAAVVIGSGSAAQQISPGDVGLELFENAAATAVGLYAIILRFGPVAGTASPGDPPDRTHPRPDGRPRRRSYASVPASGSALPGPAALATCPSGAGRNAAGDDRRLRGTLAVAAGIPLLDDLLDLHQHRQPRRLGR